MEMPTQLLAAVTPFKMTTHIDSKGRMYKVLRQVR